jgi:HAD superfamily hydrolase (TIGR01509 family)
MPIRGVLFDMDGVVVTQRLDFPAIKREIFGSPDGLILERMAELSAVERERAEIILERHERAAALAAEPMEGLFPLLEWMQAMRLRRGLVTRNSRQSVALVLERLGLRFEAVITREDAPPKPAPDPVWLACRGMGVSPAETVFVGDFELDMLAGKRAGVRTVLLRSGAQAVSAHADGSIGWLGELQDWLKIQGGVCPAASGA